MAGTVLGSGTLQRVEWIECIEWILPSPQESTPSQSLSLGEIFLL